MYKNCELKWPIMILSFVYIHYKYAKKYMHIQYSFIMYRCTSCCVKIHRRRMHSAYIPYTDTYS